MLMVAVVQLFIMRKLMKAFYHIFGFRVQSRNEVSSSSIFTSRAILRADMHFFPQEGGTDNLEQLYSAWHRDRVTTTREHFKVFCVNLPWVNFPHLASGVSKVYSHNKISISLIPANTYASCTLGFTQITDISWINLSQSWIMLNIVPFYGNEECFSSIKHCPIYDCGDSSCANKSISHNIRLAHLTWKK